MTLTIHQVPLLVTAFVSVPIVRTVWRRRRAPGALAFIMMAILSAVWSIAYVLEIGAVSLTSKLFWANCQYVSIPFIPLLWLVFAVSYASAGQRPTRRELVLLAAIPAATMVLAWTSSCHGLVRQNVSLDTSGPFSVIAKTYGPWFWVHLGYTYVVLLFGSVTLLRATLRSAGIFRQQALLIILSIVLPLAGNVAYLVGQRSVVRLDPTPVTFTLSAALLAYALYRYHLLDIMPAARELVVESMNDGVVVLDTQERVVDMNPMAQSIFGCANADVVGRRLSEVMAPGTEVLDLYVDAARTRGDVAFGSEGTHRHYDMSISTVCTGRGHRAGQVITLRDVTERKRLEEQLRQAQKLEAVGVLAGGIAHHYNNLLMIVIGYSQCLVDSLSDSPLRADAEAVLAAGKQAADLTRRLLLFSRPQRAFYTTVDLNQVVRNLEETVRQAAEPQVQLNVHLADTDTLLSGDPHLIEQLLMALISNAMDAMPDGGALLIQTEALSLTEPLAVGGTLLLAGAYVTLTVADTGLGMAAEVKQHLFEPFYTTKEVGRGAGLGLATVYGIVNELKGYVDISSEPGRGTTVRLYLPQTEQ